MIEEHLYNIEQSIAAIRNELSEHTAVTVVQVGSGRVRVSWEGPEGQPDIVYSNGNKSYRASDYIPISNPSIIGGLTEGRWDFMVQVGGTIIGSDSVDITTATEVNNNIDATTPIKYVGFWDHEYLIEDNHPILNSVTVGKTMSVDNLKNVIDNSTSTVPMIPHVGGFMYHQSHMQWVDRCRSKNAVLSNYREDVLFINLLDEPIGPWNAHKLDILADIARTTFSLPVGYTFKKLTINSLSRNLPTGIDWCGINYYTFRNDEHAFDTKQAYIDHFCQTVDNARARCPAKIFVTLQAFFGDESQKYAMPHPDSPLWAQEAANKMGIDLLLFWLWRGRHGYTGAEHMQPFVDNIKLITMEA